MATATKSDRETILKLYDAYALGIAELVSRYQEQDDKKGTERAKSYLAAWDSLRRDALAGRFD